MRFAVVLFAVTAACLASLAGAGPVTRADSFTPIQKLCSVRNTASVLGYSIGGQPVYDTECSGVCLNIAHHDPLGDDPFRLAALLPQRRCLPKEYEDVWVQTKFSSEFYFAKLVRKRRIKSCSCQRVCVVDGRVYTEGQSVTNSCGDSCKCINGFVTQCCRRRKSFLHMSETERLRYTTAIVDISTGSAPATAAMKAQYDSLIADHEAVFNSGIHHPDELLPWHRVFILRLEDILRSYDCKITVPYWAWELSHADPWGSPLWNADQHWFGAGSGGACVPDGPFVSPGFSLTPSAGGGCLRRRRLGSVPSPADVSNLLATPATSFSSFNSAIDGMHGGVHCSIHGTMCSLGSANAPEFFLHHGNMDRLWAKWQAKSNAHLWAFTAAINTPMTPASTAAGGIEPADVMDISDHLGVCVKYQEPRWIWFDIIDILAAVKETLTKSIASISPQWKDTAIEWYTRVRQIDEKEAQALLSEGLKQLEPVFSIPSDTKDAVERESGFSRQGLEEVLRSVAEDQGFEAELRERAKNALADLSRL